MSTHQDELPDIDPDFRTMVDKWSGTDGVDPEIKVMSLDDYNDYVTRLEDQHIKGPTLDSEGLAAAFDNYPHTTEYVLRRKNKHEKSRHPCCEAPDCARNSVSSSNW